jgi:chromosome partitioning protein
MHREIGRSLEEHVPVIGVIGTKSGTGKTMVSVLLAAEWMRRGKKVLLLDADPLGMALYWGGLAKDQCEVHPAFESFETALQGRSIDELVALYDIILIDCPSSPPELIVRAIAMSDLVVIPCRAWSAQVEAVTEAGALVEKARAEGHHVDAAVLISRRSLTRALDPDFESDLAAAGLPVLRTRMHQRVILQQAYDSGGSASEFAPGAPAEAEIESLADELESRLQSRV